MNSTEYKIYHESFMKNNNGTSAVQTFFRIFLTVQTSLLCSIRPKTTEINQYANEYICIVLSMIVVHTILIDNLYIFNLIAFSFIVFEFLQFHKLRDIWQILQSKNNFHNKRINSISCMRGLTYLITVFCILAVDFQDFPRYLAKTEKYGYSLMDTGVGLFVLMSGLIHKDITGNIQSVMKNNSKFILILLSLGLVRYFSVKQLDYHEHITEYGVHWNFFFTLAVCKLVASVILYFSKQALFLSLLTLIVHESSLYVGLQDWVFSNNARISLIEANREGISSSLGYVSLYLFAVYVKTVLNNNSVTKYQLIKQFMLSSISLWLVSYVVNIYRQTSRTLANAGFCLYLMAIFVTVLTVMYFLEAIYQDKERHLSFEIPLILSAVNYNGLIYFIVANLLTGLINLTIRTLLVPSYMTFIILNNYMLVTIGFSVYMKKCGIKI